MPGATLLALRNVSGGFGGMLPGASGTLMRTLTELLDYLSVEEMLTSVDESSVVYRGSAKFGGVERASPSLPPAQTLPSPGGRELSWLDCVPTHRPLAKRGGRVQSNRINRTRPRGFAGAQHLLQNLADAPGTQVFDSPGTDFRLELLIRTVRLTLPGTLWAEPLEGR